MSERDPVNVAREVWPLEWAESSFSTKGAPCIHACTQGIDISATWDVYDDTWYVEEDMWGIDLWGPDLHEVLTRARSLTLACIEGAAEKCRDPHSVPVYISEDGEAVLMLTSSNRGHVVPVPVRVIVDGVDGVSPMYEGQSSPSRVETRDGMEGRTHIVRETVEDIQATLTMLAKREGVGK